MNHGDGGGCRPVSRVARFCFLWGGVRPLAALLCAFSEKGVFDDPTPQTRVRACLSLINTRTPLLRP